MTVMVTVVGHGCHGSISGDMAVMVTVDETWLSW